VQSKVRPGDVRAQLPSRAPEAPENWDSILGDVEQIVMPALANWQSPGWFAYFPATSAPPAILGELLCAGLAQQGMLWSTSPACTEVETHVMDWLAELCALPAKFRSDGSGGGVIQDSASSGSLVALVAARERVRRSHSDIPLERMVAYTSTQTHSSLVKGARVAGYGHVREVAVDDAFAMDVDALRAAITDDRAAGLLPAFVCATIGTTSSGAVDPLPAIGAAARDESIWCHVDAAWAGAVGICPEHRAMFDGLEFADSYLWNPHKWLMTNFDCTAFWIADRRELIDTFSIVPEYLRNETNDVAEVIDYRDWQIPLGRRFRALKLWFTLRSFGAVALREHLRNHIALAEQLEQRIVADDRFEMVAPRSLALLCFRHRDGDHATRALLDALNATNRVFLGTTRLRDQLVIRVAIGSPWPVADRVEELWQLIDRLA
jgi:aromatic-L-amino-acid decarboxylase